MAPREVGERVPKRRPKRGHKWPRGGDVDLRERAKGTESAGAVLGLVVGDEEVEGDAEADGHGDDEREP